MTAAQIIEKAAVKASLAVPGTVSTLIAGLGLDTLNRWYRLCWNTCSHRNSLLTRQEISVVAGTGVVEIPTAIDGVRSVFGPNGPILPLGDVSESDFSCLFQASGVPARFVHQADSLDDDSKPVNVIRLIPSPSEALTITVSGFKRFVELAASDTPLLSQYADALYYYVLSEFYEYSGELELSKSALKSAGTHKAIAAGFETGVNASDDVSVPVESLING